MAEYNTDLQQLFIDMMISDSDLFVRIRNIIDYRNFHVKFQKSIKFIVDYSDKHRAMPDVKQIKAKSGIEVEQIDLDQNKVEWFLNEFELFSRHMALDRAILESSDLLEKGEYGTVERIIKEAVQVGLTRNMGIKYWKNPKERLLRIRETNSIYSTGWPTLDRKLYGGFEKGTLNIFAGGSGVGKSLALQNLALNWALTGLNVIYVSLELSEDLTSMRIDSMVTNVPTKEIFKKIDDVDLRVQMVGKKAGDLDIVKLPAQSTTIDIKTFVKEWEIQNEHRIDAICVDYLDLVMPVTIKINPSDIFTKDKYVCEEFQVFAEEYDVYFATASQLNRSAVEEIEFDHSMIAGGISKINTAHNVIGIFTSRAHREKNRIQFQLMKTRSSSGIGSKIDMGFDPNSLRIIDIGVEADDIITPVSVIKEKLKSRSITVPGISSENSPNKEHTPEADGARLREMLKSVKDEL